MKTKSIKSSNRVLRSLVLTSAVAAALSLPHAAKAESNFTSPGVGTPITATARLDFQITIPRILFLQVGTGTNLAANATVNQIAFTVPGVNVGDSSVIGATAASGDLGNGQVTARVIGNNGNITFSSATLGALGNGLGDTISYAQIATAAVANTSATVLAHPALADAATTSIVLIPAAGKVINRDAKWTYTYLNQNVVAPGTYGGVNANNSRVTYTASMP